MAAVQPSRRQLALFATAGLALILLARRRRNTAKRPVFEILEQAPAASSATHSFVVTGGTGTLGARLLRALLDRHPRAHVVSLDLCPPAADRRVAGVTYLLGDVADGQHLGKAIDVARTGGAELSCVFHQAGLIPSCATSWASLDAINGQGTADFVEACVQKGVARLVYTSSCSVVMNRTELNYDRAIGEKLPYPSAPELFIDEYAHSKSIGERAVLGANGRRGLSACALRPSVIFDGRDRKLVQGLLQGRNNTKFSGGHNVIDFVWAVDVARAHVSAAEALVERPAQIAGRAIHVGGNGLPTKEFYGMPDDENPQKTIWGLSQPMSVPFGVVLGSAYFNYGFYLLTGIAPLDFFLRPDSLCFIGGRSWCWDCSEAKRILGWEATPLQAAARTIREEAGITKHRA